MSRLWTRFVAPVAALLLLSAAQVRAGNISWNYNWTPGSLFVSADGNTGGAVTFTNETPNSAIGSSDVTVTNLRTISGASPTSPDTFNTNGSYTLTLQLTDVASGQSGTLTFTGKLGGSFSQSNANVSNKFTGQLTQQLFLGDNTYTVTIGPYTPPGPPDANNAGSISAHIDVEPSAVITSESPEPSTMALSLFGLTTIGAGWWRKRRAAR